MLTPLQQLESRFRKAIREALDLDADPQVAPAQSESFGDYQCNAAMGLARESARRSGEKTSPRAIAEKIMARVDLGEMSTEVSVAGAGFINVRLAPAWLSAQARLAAASARLGVDPDPDPQTIVVDYSGPNIAKQMHVGHLRSTIIGDALARTLEFLGHRVIRQNHVGDWGLQMGMVTHAIEEAGGTAGLTLDRLESLYRGISAAVESDPATYQKVLARTRALQQADPATLENWTYARRLTLDACHALYRRLGVTLTEEHVRGESAYAGEYAELVERLLAAGHARYTEGAVGIFPPGFTNKEGEPRPFLIRSRDGTYQYPTFDLAAIRYRLLDLKADRIIYTHDSRQAEHFAMLFAVARLLGWAGERVRLDFAPFGTVLGEDNRPLKTRTGENVKLADLLDEAEARALAIVSEKNPALDEPLRRRIAHAVGVGAVKYADLSKERISDYVFAFDRMLSFDGNTAPYLQNAFVRVRGIFRKAQAAGIDSDPAPEAIDLAAPQELALARHLLRFQDVLLLVVRELKPNHLCQYLFDLAARFHQFFEHCPVIQSDPPLRRSRLALCDLTGRTLGLGLDLLGIEHPEVM